MSNVAPAVRLAQVPPPHLQRRVRALVDQVGLVRAAKTLGLSRMTTASLAGGMRVQAGSIYQAEARCP